jgi:hypothetical protein
MKAVKWIFAIALLLSLCLMLTCKKEGDEVAVKIDDENYTINQFNNYYYMFARMMMNMDKKDADKMASNPEIENHPTMNLLNKSKFMEYFVSRKLLYIKAYKDDSINKDDLNTVSELAKLQFISSYYLSQKLKDEIKVTDEDVNNFYNKNRDQLKGVPMNDEIINRIKQQIFMEKLEIKSNQFILEILGEIKVNKDGFKKYIAKLKSEKDSKEKKEEKQEKGDKQAPKNKNDKK